MRKFQKWYPLFVLIFFYVISNTVAKPLEESILVASEQQLSGLVIGLDAGHGGKDNGADVLGVVEDELNLEVVFALRDVLEMAGAEVILTRDGDYDLASLHAINRKKEDLNKRVGMLDGDEVALFISIHMNKYENKVVSGAQVFYRVNDEGSKLLATLIQEEFKSLKSTKLSSVGNYYILNNSITPGVLVECGFMSNEKELQLLQDQTYHTKLAYAIYRGIAEFVNQQYVVLR